MRTEHASYSVTNLFCSSPLSLSPILSVFLSLSLSPILSFFLSIPTFLFLDLSLSLLKSGPFPASFNIYFRLLNAVSVSFFEWASIIPKILLTLLNYPKINSLERSIGSKRGILLGFNFSYNTHRN